MIRKQDLDIIEVQTSSQDKVRLYKHDGRCHNSISILTWTVSRSSHHAYHGIYTPGFLGQVLSDILEKSGNVQLSGHYISCRHGNVRCHGNVRRCHGNNLVHVVGESGGGLCGCTGGILFGGELCHGVVAVSVIGTAVVGTLPDHGVRGRDGSAAVTVGRWV